MKLLLMVSALNVFLSLVAMLLMACSPTKVTAPEKAPSESSGLTLRELEMVRDRFVTRIGDQGLALDPAPQILEWTRPSFMSWRAEKNAVAVPVWDELSASQRELLVKMGGSEKNAQELFNLLFRWFLLPHELTHALQGAPPQPLDHAQAERHANDVAVAFWLGEAQGAERLAALQSLLMAAAARLPIATRDGMTQDEYFNANYDQFPQCQTEYAAYQVAFILNSIGKRNELDFRQLVGLPPPTRVEASTPQR